MDDSILTPNKHRLKLVIAYDGTDYGGWQRQSHGPPTIQGSMEKILSHLFDEPIHLIASGRTDAGVHAVGQVVHCDVTRDPSSYQLIYALQGLMPCGIVVRKAYIAPPDFHAIASAERKTYRYFILNRPIRSVFHQRFSTWVRKPLDLDYLNETSRYLLGNQDFKSFQNVGTETKSSVRTVYEAQWKRKKHGMIEFQITGNGFLKQMVRNIVGTLLDFSLNNTPPEQLKEILACCDRRKAKRTAPPEGLFLYKVYYPENLDKRCRRL